MKTHHILLIIAAVLIAWYCVTKKRQQPQATTQKKKFKTLEQQLAAQDMSQRLTAEQIEMEINDQPLLHGSVWEQA